MEEDDKELLQIRIETLKTMIGKLKRNKPNSNTINTVVSSRETVHTTTSSFPSTSSALSWTKLQAFRKQSNRFTFKKTEAKSHSDTELIIKEKSKHNQIRAAQENTRSLTYQGASRYKWDKSSPTKYNTTNSIIPSTNGSRNHTFIPSVTGSGSHTFVPSTTGNSSHIFIPSTTSSRNHTFITNTTGSGSHTFVPSATGSRNHTVISKFKLVKKNIPNEAAHRKVPKRTNQFDKVEGIKYNNITTNQTNSTSVSSIASINNVNIFPKRSADIFSKYKVVRTTKPNTLPRIKKQDSANSFVWKKGDSTVKYSSSSLAMNKKKYAEQKHPTKDSFIRRRFNVTRRASIVQTNFNVIALNQPQSNISRTVKKRRESFALRRLKYVKMRSPAVIHINNSNLKSPNKHVILSRHGTHYKVAGNFRSLRRLSVSTESKPKQKPTSAKRIVKQSKYKFQRSNSLKSSSVKRKVASQVLKRSLTQAQRKKVNRTKFCLFYNRFGKCKRGTHCKYIHDPDKIAVCTRFLRGTCKDEKCLFSHKIDPKKMPVCSYFLLGQCSKDVCPYRHVNVGETALVCDDFLKGYCPREEKCTKKHVLQCIEFSKTGKCRLGKKCSMIHRVKGKRRRLSSMSGARKPRAFREKKRKVDDNSDVVSSNHVAEQSTSNVLVDSPLRNIAKLQLLPKFISEKINAASDNKEPNKQHSFSAMRNLFNFENRDMKACDSMDSVENISDMVNPATSSTNQDEFIPLGYSSSQHLSRTFSFKEQDFIALD